MIDVEGSIIINRPIEEVFAFVADQRNAPRWQDGLLEVRRTTGGPIGVGTKHQDIAANFRDLKALLEKQAQQILS